MRSSRNSGERRPIRSRARRLVWPTTLAGHGTLASFTTIRVPPTVFQGQEPYNIAVIDLDEGLRVTARLTVVEGREATIGDPVIFEEIRSYGTIFRLS